MVQTGTVTFTEGDIAPLTRDSLLFLMKNGQPAASVEAKSPNIPSPLIKKQVDLHPNDKSYSGDVVPVKVQAADYKW